MARCSASPQSSKLRSIGRKPQGRCSSNDSRQRRVRPQGLKPRRILSDLMARLKSCPTQNPSDRSFSRSLSPTYFERIGGTTEVAPYPKPFRPELLTKPVSPTCLSDVTARRKSCLSKPFTIRVFSTTDEVLAFRRRDTETQGSSTPRRDAPERWAREQRSRRFARNDSLWLREAGMGFARNDSLGLTEAGDVTESLTPPLPLY
jgi:hypothetical protein